MDLLGSRLGVGQLSSYIYGKSGFTVGARRSSCLREIRLVRMGIRFTRDGVKKFTWENPGFGRDFVEFLFLRIICFILAAEYFAVCVSRIP